MYDIVTEPKIMLVKHLVAKKVPIKGQRRTKSLHSNKKRKAQRAHLLMASSMKKGKTEIKKNN